MLKQLVSGIKTVLSILLAALFIISTAKHIKKVFFIEVKKMEKFVRNLLNENMVLKNWVSDSVYSQFWFCLEYDTIIFFIFVIYDCLLV